MRRERRRAERAWRKSGLVVHKEIYVQARDRFNRCVEEAKSTYYKDRLQTRDKKVTFKVLKSLLNSQESTLPDHSNEKQLCNDFVNFFTDKVRKIKSSISVQAEKLGPSQTVSALPEACASKLGELTPTSVDELRAIIKTAAPKSCSLDTLPTELLKDDLETHLPILTELVNSSLTSGHFPSALKHGVVRPLIKKANLDHNQMKNYRPVTNLSFVNKILEKVVV